MSVLIKLLVVVFAITLIVFMFLFYMNIFLVVDQELVVVDAIVVLMGGNPERIPIAADIYKNGFADKLIIAQGISSEAAEGKRDAIKLGIPEENIIVIPGKAVSTWDEAKIVYHFLSKRADINSLILVTSERQTRRALLTFNKYLSCLNRDVKIISKTAPNNSLQLGLWWQDKQSFKALTTESVKYIYYLLRVLIYKGCDDIE